MGMLQDGKPGLTPEQDEENPFLEFATEEPQAPETPAVQPEAPSINNEQAAAVDTPEEPEANPFAEFAVGGLEDAPADPETDGVSDNPFSEFKVAEPVVAEPVVEPEGGQGIGAAAWSGLKTMGNALRASVNSFTHDAEDLEDLAADAAKIHKTDAQERFGKAFENSIKENEGFVDAVVGVSGAIWEQKQGAAHEMVAQTANMLPILGGAAAGAKLGAIAGALTGPAAPVAVPVLAVVGSVIGMFTGNAAIEMGHGATAEAQKPGVITDEQMTDVNVAAGKKAAVITAIDMATMGANRMLMGAPGRAGSAAATKLLASKGIDTTNDVAVRAALEGSQELMEEVMEATAEAVAKATGTVLGKKGARGLTEAGLEMVGEGSGEYLGTLASGGDASFSEAVLESFMAGPMSAAELAFVATRDGAKSKFGPRKEDVAGLQGEVDAAMGDRVEVPTEEEAVKEEGQQAAEAESRVKEMETGQEEARQRVLSQGGDMLDAEMAAAETNEFMAESENKIRSHLSRMQQKIDAQGKVDKAQEKVDKEREKTVLADKKATESAVQKSRKATEEDKAYEQRDTGSILGQTGTDIGHIESAVTPDQAAAVKKSSGSERGSQLADAFTAAANEAATSPTNSNPAPTPNQIEAGNYKKGHQKWQGMDITVENPAGSTREAADGSWKQDMQDHYGYIRGTVSAEGTSEQLDVFVGKDLESDTVAVVDQINKDGAFDEHKVMIGYPNAVAARRAYARNYPKGFKVGKINTMTTAEFKDWLKNGDQTVPYSPAPKKAAPKPEELTVGEQAEAALEDTRGNKKSIRYRKEDTVEDKILAAAPADIVEELEYLSEGFEEGPDIKLAFEDALDVAESNNNKPLMTKLRKVGIAAGMYVEMDQAEIDRTITNTGKVWDFALGGKKYKFSDDYKMGPEEKAATGETVEAKHYGKEGGLDILSGAKYGTGIKGAEASRLSDPAAADIKDRVYFYGPEGKKEAGLGANEYSWTQEGIYDLDNDPDGFRAQVRADAKKGGYAGDRETMANNLDRAIKDAGYAGVNSKKMNDTGYVFGDVAVPKDAPLKGTKIVDEKGVPLVVYRGVDAANADKRRVALPTFTPNKYVAGDYAADHKEGVVSSYRLNIKNPVDLDTGGDIIRMGALKKLLGPLDAQDQKLLEAMVKQPWNWRGWSGSPMENSDPKKNTVDTLEEIPDQGYTDTFEIADTEEFVELMKKRGYDGIIIRGPINPNDEADVIPTEEFNRLEMDGEVEYRPFDESQIIEEMARDKSKPLRYRKDDQVDAKSLLADIKKDGDGFTVDAATGEKITTGFAAGMGKEQVFEKRKATEAEVDAYREKHADLLAQKDHFLGAWMYEGDMFLDVSNVYTNTDMGRKRAYEKAKSIGEYGIQHLDVPVEEGYIPIDYKPGQQEAIRGGEKFKSWFGDSKVVDKEGDPLVVYHGTDADFDAFKANAPRTFTDTMDAEGIYFTADQQQASGYSKSSARRDAGGGKRRTVKAYLKMENPLDITNMIKRRKKGVSFADAKRAAIAKLTPEHDGVIFKGDSYNTAEYIVFKPGQIKSTDNTGDFNAADDRYRQRQTTGVPNVPMTSAKAKTVLEPVLKNLRLLKPIVLSNASEAPVDVQAQMEKDGALQSKGVYDPVSDQLYIFSENHDSDSDVVRTLLHEGVAHKGLRYVLGDTHDAVMTDIFNTGEKMMLKRTAKKYGLDPTDSSDQVEIAEEYVASVVENDVNSPVYKKVYAAVRAALRKIGVVKQWSREDVKGLLRKSKRRMKGKPFSKVQVKETRIDAQGNTYVTPTNAETALRKVSKKQKVCESIRKCVAKK